MTTPGFIRALRDAVTGIIITPEDGDDYDRARVVEAAGDLHPFGIVRATSTQDVQAVIEAVREAGVPLAVRAGGHSAAGHGTIEGGLVLDVSALKDLTIDPEARVATAGVGLTAGEFARGVGAHGLAAPLGDTAAVGLAGLTLGGGLGLLSRRFGMTIDALRGAEIVTADGVLRRIDAEHAPDLFWAIRGGGGNFGVVTSLTFDLVEVPETTGGLLVLPAEPEVLAGFLDAAARAPEALTTIVTIMRCPPMPFVPGEHHGSLVLLCNLVHVGPPEEAAAAIAPLRELAPPLADLIAPTPFADLLSWEEIPPVTAVTSTQFLDHLDVPGAREVLSAMDASPAAMSLLQLRVLGGAVARVPESETAYGFRDRAIVTYLAGMLGDPGQRAGVTDWVQALTATMDQGIPGAFVNFVGEGGLGASDCYPVPTWGRLRSIKAVYDPDNLFARNHNIPPAAG